MNKEFKINVWDIDVIVDFCFESWKVETWYFIVDHDNVLINEFKEFNAAIQLKAEQEAQDYLDYIKESYGEDRGYDRWLDQQVANEG